MSKVRLAGKKNKGKGSGVSAVKEEKNFLRRLIELAWFVYLILMAVCLPFYFEAGYNHIGTDKHTFFKYVSIWTWRMMGPLVLVYLIMGLFLRIRKACAGRSLDLMAFGKEIFRSWKDDMSLTDWAALGYGGAVLLSYALTPYREKAFWGAAGWYMGMFTQVSFVAIYFMTSRFLEKGKWLMTLFLPVSGLVFALGYLNRFGVYPIQMESANPSFISTIGNINWYCGYLVSVFFAGLYLLWTGRGKQWIRIALTAYCLIGFGSLVTQGSSSGILALGACMCTLAVLSRDDKENQVKEGFFVVVTIMSCAFLLTGFLRVIFPGSIQYHERSMDLLTISPLAPAMMLLSLLAWFFSGRSVRIKLWVRKALVFMPLLAIGGLMVLLFVIVWNTLFPDLFGGFGLFAAPAFTFSPTWGSNRGATWMAGIACFLQQSPLHMLVGAGPDCMAETLYGQGSPTLVAMVEETFMLSRLTNAHNEWLTVLVNMGLLGLFSYVCMMVSAIRRFLKAGKALPLAGACGLCLVAYTANNMVSFQQSMNGVTIYIILGLGEALMRKGTKKKS